MTTDEFADLLKKYPITIDMLFIDADYCKESVSKDFWCFFPYVKKQGLILLHVTHPKNVQYTEKGFYGDAYLVIEELINHYNEFEFVTITIHPGLTIVRKRKTQLTWEENDRINTDYTNSYFERNLNKSILMPSFISKAKQMFDGDNDINTIVEIGSLDVLDSQYYFKKIFTNAGVIAIGGLPKNYEKYLKSLTNIETIKAIVSNIDGEVTFYKKDVNGIHIIHNRGNEYGNEELKLLSYKFKTLAGIYNIKNIDLLKLDVEGATYEVLEGMSKLINTIKMMNIETGSYPFFEGQKLHSEVEKLLSLNGFSVVKLTSFPIEKGKLQYDSIWTNNKFLYK